MHVTGSQSHAERCSQTLTTVAAVALLMYLGDQIVWERLNELVAAVGKERLVLDLSCRRR
jgi:uncharacterized membrane protein affecting hemolysin expression